MHGFRILKPSISILVGGALLAGCEGGTTFTKTIVNESSEVVYLRLYTSQTPSGTDFTILPGNSKTIYLEDAMGRFVNDSYECLQEIDSITVNVAGNKIVRKDIMNPGEWYRRSRPGRNSREDCEFNVANTDLE